MTCGWRHNHPPPRVAKPTSPTAWTGRHRRVADSPIPPPTFHDQSRIPTAAGGARGQRCTTHSHTATHHHHTSPPPTPSALGGNHKCSRRQIGGPDHAGLCWPLQANNNSAPQPVMSRPPDTGSQAHRLEAGYEYAQEQYWTECAATCHSPHRTQRRGMPVDGLDAVGW